MSIFVHSSFLIVIFVFELRNGVVFPHNCDIQKCKLAVKILTNIDNEEWREEVSISVTGVIYCALHWFPIS